MRTLLLAGFLALSLLCIPAGALAQGSGSNTNFLTPVDLTTITASYLDSRSNFRLGQAEIGEFDFANSNASLTVAHRFNVLDRFAVVTASVSQVDITAKKAGGTSTEDVLGRSGWGDPSLSLRLGLHGAPAQKRAQWRPQEAGFQLYGQLGLRLPWGDYDSQRIFNPGFNRYAFDLALPMVIPLDGTRRATFLEITPAAVLFSENSDPPGLATRLKQDPLYLFEMHASHRLTPRLWLSLGLQYQNGAGASTDGLRSPDSLDQWFAEAGLGMTIGRRLSLALGYGEIVSSANNARGDAWRVRMTLRL